MIRALEISSSALTAQRVRMDVIAGNMANAFSTGQEDGTIRPFQRRVTMLRAGAPDGGPGVRVEQVTVDPSPPRMQYDPGHPHALRDGPWKGYVQFPNVNVTLEYIDALEASRAYEANLAMMNVTRNMAQQSIGLLA